jgi:hypothetical protein
MTDAPGLQLEQAEFTETQSTEASVCGYCRAALVRTYWQVGDKPRSPCSSPTAPS